MRSFGVSLALLLLPRMVPAAPEARLDCAGRPGQDIDGCEQPLEAVTAVVPALSYVAKLPCLDCPVLQTDGALRTITRQDNDLFLNFSLSHDNRTLLLNNKPIFPSLPTNPTPPEILADQVSPNFTRADLDNRNPCASEQCEVSRGECWCVHHDTPFVYLEYDYYSHRLDSRPETLTEKWEITFDAIGGYDGFFFRDPAWSFNINNSEQRMVRVVMHGREVEGERYAGEKDIQAGSSLFGVPNAGEITYEYEIASLELMERGYKFDSAKKLGLWGRIRRFFGLDVVRADGHIIYIRKEWGWYGKKGSLRNGFSNIINDWPWHRIFIILASIVGAVFALWAAYKLFWLAKQQRELLRWDGMDAVWEQMRREPGEEEDAGLLHTGYQDEPNEERALRYTDDVDTNKPLPSKPLPEKPLPAVPLIDA